jgi:hypothetical protein
MTTLFDAKLDLAKLIMRVKHGEATVLGDAGQLVDSNRVEPGDYFFRTLSNGGILFFKETKDSREIVDYADSVFAFSPADVTVALGDRYAASPVDWEFNELTEAINMALEDLGEQSGVPQIDQTLEIVSRQGIYTLPAGVFNVKKVFMILDEDNPDLFTTHHLMWREIGGELHLSPGSEPLWGDKIKLVYCAPHDMVEDDDDVISPYINPMLLKWTAAVFALENVNKTEKIVAKLNRAIKTSEAYKTRFPLEMARDPILAYFPDESGY